MTGDQEPNNSQADAEISLKKTTDFYFFTSIFFYLQQAGLNFSPYSMEPRRIY